MCVGWSVGSAVHDGNTFRYNNRGLEMIYKLLVAFIIGIIEGAILLDWYHSRQALQVKGGLKDTKLKTKQLKKGWLDD